MRVALALLLVGLVRGETWMQIARSALDLMGIDNTDSINCSSAPNPATMNNGLTTGVHNNQAVGKVWIQCPYPYIAPSGFFGVQNLPMSWLHEDVVAKLALITKLNPGLVALQLENMGIGGTADLSPLSPTLKNLFLSGNNLESVNGLGSLASLEILKIDGNKITVLPEFSTTSLKQLVVSDNMLQFLPGLNQQTALEKLDITNNKLTWLPDMSDLSQLTMLWMSGNPTINCVPQMAPGIELSSTTGNFLADADAIAGGPCQPDLNHARNALTAAGIKGAQALMCMTNGETIDRVSGEPGQVQIACSTGNVVTELNLWNFSDLLSLPDSFGSELGQLKSLTKVDMRNNALTAFPEISPAITSLKTLYLYDNKLLAAPAGLGSLTGLESVQLQRNDIKTVGDMSELVNINVFTLNDNPLQCVPEMAPGVPEFSSTGWQFVAPQAAINAGTCTVPSPSPSESPTDSPTASPTPAPTDGPTETPTLAPTLSPTDSPTVSPTQSPDAMFTSLAELRMWCSESKGNCKTCKGKYTASSFPACKVRAKKLKCAKLKKICKRVPGCSEHIKTKRKKTKVSCKGKVKFE